MSQFIKQQYEIPASIEKIHIDKFSRVALENVLILDQQGDTLIASRSATASLSPLKIIDGIVQINTLSFAAPTIKLQRDTAGAPLNIQYIIDIVNKDKNDESKTDLRINQLLIYDGQFSYDVASEAHSESMLDVNHIAISNFSSNISLKNFNKENLNIYIRSISGKEKSGLELNKLRARIAARGNEVELSNLYISLPSSELYSERITAYSNNCIDSLKISGNLTSNRLSFKDLIPLIPGLSAYELDDIEFSIDGSIDSYSADGNIRISTRDKSAILSGRTTVLSPYDNKRSAKIKIEELFLKEKFIDKVTTLIEGAPQGIAQKLGDTNINGEITLSSDSLAGDANIACSNGSVSTNIQLDDRGNFHIKAHGKDIAIGNIINSTEIKSCDIYTTGKGNFKETTADFTGRISSLELKGYKYAPINIKGNTHKRDASVTITTADPNITATIHINHRTLKKKSHTALTLNVDSLRLKSLNLVKEIKEGTLSFALSGEYESLKDNGSLLNAKMQNFTFDNGTEKSTIRNLHLHDDNTQAKRSITINSDILNADIIGYFDIAKIGQSFLHAAKSHLPALPIEKNKGGNNSYLYRFEILNTRIIEKLIDLPFTINEKSTISGSCHDPNGDIGISAILNNVKVGKSEIRSINLEGKSSEKGISLLANVYKPSTKVIDNNGEKTTINKNLTVGLKSIIKDGAIRNVLNWNDIASNKSTRGEIGVNATLARGTDNKLQFEANFTPGNFFLDDAEWHVTPGSIKGNSEKILVNDLQIFNREQSLKIDGVAGKFIQDSLNVYLKNLEVATIMSFINFNVLKFKGKATGSAHLTSLLYRPDVNGRFDVDSLHIDNALVGQGDIGIGWMDYNKTISLNCGILNKGKEKSEVVGFLSPANDTIMLKIDARDLNAKFINEKVSSFLGDIKGKANGTAYVLGSWKKVDLKGAVALDCSARVNASNVVYNILGDTLYMSPGVLYFDGIDLSDRNGNRGKLSGRITHKHFGEWKCDINAQAERMLVYDTGGFSDLPFYGTIYATGGVNISSDGSNLMLKANVSSEPGSTFVYNSSTASGASDNSFITFTDSRKKNSGKKEVEEPDNDYNMYDRIASKLHLDFMIDATEDLHVKVYTDLKSDDYISFNGNGTINALYDDKDGFSLNGGLNLDRGTYKFTIQNIFPKEFNLEKGSTLTFDGDPYHAGLNLKAKYLVPSASLSDLTTESTKNKTVKVNCVMDIGGTLESPELHFDLELPEGSEEEKELLASVASTQEQKTMQFIYLLGVGKFYTYDYNNAQTESQTSSAVESLISNTLSGQLNNMLGHIINNNNWNISGNFSTSERGWNRMEVEGMLRGRLLNNRLLINGNFGYRENPIANSNFMGDFEIQWLLNKKGNVNLKAYSKTNDRYFSKTNLTTQGAGIIFKFDFNHWRWWKKRKKQESTPAKTPTVAKSGQTTM